MTSKLDYPKRHAGLFRRPIAPLEAPARKTKPKPPPKAKKRG
jgi:hypothetical protein